MIIQSSTERDALCEEIVRILVEPTPQKGGGYAILLKAIAISAVSEGLRVTKDDRFFSEKVGHLYGYLCQWVIPSLEAGGTALPLSKVSGSGLSPKEAVDALSHIRKELLTHPKMKEYLSDDAREMFDYFVAALIARLQVANNLLVTI